MIQNLSRSLTVFFDYGDDMEPRGRDGEALDEILSWIRLLSSSTPLVCRASIFECGKHGSFVATVDFRLIKVTSSSLRVQRNLFGSAALYSNSFPFQCAQFMPTSSRSPDLAARTRE